MVKMTMIARVTDGLPLAEGLDDGRDLVDSEMYKQQVKALFKNLSKGHIEASRMSVETGPYVFHSYPKKIAFHSLEDLKNEFERVYGAHIETAARLYAFIKFGHPNSTEYTKLNDELYEVQQIMTRNVQEVLGVGEKLDQVSQMSRRLTSESRIYADKARDLNRQFDGSLCLNNFPVGFNSEVGPGCHRIRGCLPPLLGENKAVVIPTVLHGVNSSSSSFSVLVIRVVVFHHTIRHRDKLAMIMAAEPVNINEFQELARQALSKMYYDFINGGAEDQYTLRENEEAFHRITIQPRVLLDVSSIDLSTTVFGYNISIAVMIAPTSRHKLANPSGEIATARAASACNTIVILSLSSTCTLEEVLPAAMPFGFSNYTIVIPELKNVEGLLTARFVDGGGSNLDSLENSTSDPSFSWEVNMDKSFMLSCNIHRMVEVRHKIANSDQRDTHCEDAIKALEVGASGIIVSNQGARQLDYCPATISVLEEVVRAVGGKVPVFLDEGVRRGPDIFKAMALGAQAVLVGRPVMYGLAARGEYGVRRVPKCLRTSLNSPWLLLWSAVVTVTNDYDSGKSSQQLWKGEGIRFNLASRSASGSLCGMRIVAGRIVKESYVESK
ncbi:25.3 kDa vesicle transport protein [Hibiscus syriacus]|uniref:25.3 kDa vesicle transport protein n=1 Tax=Hibiscus syriacus TaxID=106335 RepID=A0A6A2YBR3_HIBSY|nr:25.3 kDa vesicle transport protein [Hibiscus syriacus]